jgi:hypothetical protein
VKPSGVQPRTSRAKVGAGGSEKPSSSAAGDVFTTDPTGVGVRERPTASATVAAITTSSPAATRTNTRTSSRAPEEVCARASSWWTVRLRCHHPNPPSTTSAAVLASTRTPYDEVTSGPNEPSRTPALTTPETATVTKHHRASVENRGTACRNPSPPTAAHTRPASPPTHSEAASTCTSRLATASS